MFILLNILLLNILLLYKINKNIFNIELIIYYFILYLIKTFLDLKKNTFLYKFLLFIFILKY